MTEQELASSEAGREPASVGIHLLKNGHPAHVFTEEDRRKAAAVTSEIRREKRALLEQLRIGQEIERMMAADEARRQRRREKRRSKARIERYGRSELARPTDRDARSEAPPSANDPYENLPANERQALERGWTGELG